MKNIVEAINDKNYSEAEEIINSKIKNIMETKLAEMKKMVGAKMEQFYQNRTQKKVEMDVLEQETVPVPRPSPRPTPNQMDAAKEELKDKLYMNREVERLKNRERIAEETDIEKSRKKLEALDREIKRAQKNFGDKLNQEVLRSKRQNPAKKGMEAAKKDKEQISEEELDEAARIKIIKARIRGGKIQRRKKISNVQGYTLRGGKLKRMSPAERRKRKLGQRRGKIKRRAKLQRTLMKREKSLRKRKALGI